MPVTNDQKLMFLKAVYEGTEGKLMSPLNMWEVGRDLGWDRDTTDLVFERVSDDGYLEPYSMGGNFLLTQEGLKLCEEIFGASPERRVNRIRLLKAIYEETDGSTSSVVSGPALGEKLGLDRDEVSEGLTYLVNEYLLEWEGISGMVSLTRYGVEYVEEDLEGLPSLDDAVARGHEDTGLPLPHTHKQEYAFFAVDIVDHSRIVKDERTEDANAALDGFHDYVLQECGKRMGYELSWGGDGGLCCFHGQNCQVRAAEAALGIVDGLPMFNDKLSRLSKPIQIRVGVHTGSFAMPEDPGSIHSADLNLAKHLEGKADPDGALITGDIYKELPDRLKRPFEKVPQPSEEVAVYAYVAGFACGPQ